MSFAAIAVEGAATQIAPDGTFSSNLVTVAAEPFLSSLDATAGVPAYLYDNPDGSAAAPADAYLALAQAVLYAPGAQYQRGNNPNGPIELDGVYAIPVPTGALELICDVGDVSGSVPFGPTRATFITSALPETSGTVTVADGYAFAARSGGVTALANGAQLYCKGQVYTFSLSGSTIPSSPGAGTLNLTAANKRASRLTSVA